MSAAQVFQVLALRAAGSFLVKIYRDPQLFSHPASKSLRYLDAFLHAAARDRHKWHHVCGADARVFAPVLVQVDQLRRLRDRAEGGFFNRRGWAAEGQHGAVVVQVGVPVQQADRLAPIGWPL